MKRPTIHLARFDGAPLCGQRRGLPTTETLALATCGNCKERVETGGRLLPRTEAT